MCLVDCLAGYSRAGAAIAGAGPGEAYPAKRNKNAKPPQLRG